jgi:signal transduction histidine kinase
MDALPGQAPPVGVAARQGLPPPLCWLWPGSLAGRTALVLLLGLTLVQAAGLTIHALDRVDLQRFAQAREISARAFGLWSTVALAPPERRAQMLADVELPAGLTASLDDQALGPAGTPPPPPPIMRLFRVDRLQSAGPMRFRPREVRVGPLGPPGQPMLLLPPPLPMPEYGPPMRGRDRGPMRMGDWTGPPRLGDWGASLRLADGQWLNLQVRLEPPRPWHSETFLMAFAVMTFTAGALTLWAVRRLIWPVRALADAADRLGRDVNAPPLPENGPTEIARAAAAFNTMAERIRRFVGDRTQLLAAIGHDLRTPITRLRLRAEFMDDDEQRRKMLADLAEMEAMITATLAFARDDSAAEPNVALDLVALCRTVLDDAADAHPDLAEQIDYAGPERLVVQARPVALKRAIANLVGNALAYGQAARLRLIPAGNGQPVRLEVEDDGPGIPPSELENVFLPFRRLEASRNRETGGAGLGLPIARNILRAHGGDVVLRNRPGGGALAVATLPM